MNFDAIDVRFAKKFAKDKGRTLQEVLSDALYAYMLPFRGGLP